MTGSQSRFSKQQLKISQTMILQLYLGVLPSLGACSMMLAMKRYEFTHAVQDSPSFTVCAQSAKDIHRSKWQEGVEHGVNQLSWLCWG